MSKLGDSIKNINKLGINNDKLKFLNFVATSDCDSSYLKPEWKNLAKKLRLLYIFIIFFVVVISFLPMFLPANQQIEWTQSFLNLGINIFIFVVLIIDYIFRWITYPVRAGKYSISPLLFFPLTGVSILMLISILPTALAVFAKIIPANNPFVKLINVFAIVKVIRLLMLLKIIPTFNIFSSIFSKNKTLLINVFAFVFIMAVLFALTIYSVEGVSNWVPGTVDPNNPNVYIPPEGAIGLPNEKHEWEVPVNPGIRNFWDALYFTFITITTIGYGDISPKTDIGRVIVIIDAVIGILVFSIPSGIITGSFIVEVQQRYKERKKTQKEIEMEKLSFAEKLYIKTKEKTKEVATLDKYKNKKENKGKYERIFEIKGDDINEKSQEIINKILAKLDSNNIARTIVEDKKIEILVKDDRYVYEDFYKLVSLLGYTIEEKDVNDK